MPAGTRVLALEDDHASAVLEWTTRAAAQGFTVDVVQRPDGADWTAAVLAEIRPAGCGTGPRSPRSRRCPGRMGDAEPRADFVCLRRRELPCWSMPPTPPAWSTSMSRKLDPDFVVFPTYKWLLGPYGRAFLYIARRQQAGVPLEQTSYGRRAVSSDSALGLHLGGVVVHQLLVIAPA